MSKIWRPILPIRTGIPGGVYDGKMIEIKGRIPNEADRIGINLIGGFDPSADRVLHLKIRFDQHCVARNHQQNSEWGPEETDGPFPFSPGSEFTIMITAEREKYGIAVNNQHCWDFKHRLPMDRIKSIGMYGSADVYEIEFIDRPNPADEMRCIDRSIPVTPARSDLAPVYNPVIPYAYPIYGGLKLGMAIDISGRPSSNPSKFSINLQKGASEHPPPDVAFHFSPLFSDQTVVRNTRSNGVWASKETSVSQFPFHPGVSFDLMIRVEADRFSVSVNGKHFTDFRHRLKPLEMFDTLYICDDVSISSIRFS